jgi:hypothetical protein
MMMVMLIAIFFLNLVLYPFVDAGSGDIGAVAVSIIRKVHQVHQMAKEVNL